MPLGRKLSRSTRMTPTIVNSPPANEPEHHFVPGTPEGDALDAALASREVVDIPAVINGERIASGDVDEVRAPHDRQRVLARVHKPSAEVIERAIAGSRAAAADWARIPYADRAAIFLRAAELCATRYRVALNAATMLGQSKTLDQAEPDAACELIDFLRFNEYSARRLLAEHPLSTATARNRIDWRPLEGFVYAISPFNFTAIGANLSTAPALM